MGIFDALINLINGIVGLLNDLLTLIESIFAPIISLLDRWNAIFGFLGQW